MTELITSVLQLIILIIYTSWMKSKLEHEKKLKYEKKMNEQLNLCLKALTKIRDEAKEDYKMSVDDEQDEDLKPN